MPTSVFPIDQDVLQAAVTELMYATSSGDFETELAAAAAFVFRYGALGEIFDEPELSRAQFARAGCSAWSFLGHWSTERNDPDPDPGLAVDEICADRNCQICPMLEQVHTTRGVFEYERCEECGGDLDVHDVGLDGIGLLRLICCGRWMRVEPLVAEAGDIDPEQISDAYSARWIAPLEDGEWAVVTRSYCVAERDNGRRVALIRDDHYQVCTDPNSPGDTEVRSAGAVHELDSDDPLNENPHHLAAESFAPDPLEFDHAIPDAPPYFNRGE